MSSKSCRSKSCRLKSAFLSWFEAQAGKGPSGQETVDLENKLVDKRREFAQAEAALAAARNYQLMKQFALYGWIAGVAHSRRLARGSRIARRLQCEARVDKVV